MGPAIICKAGLPLEAFARFSLPLAGGSTICQLVCLGVVVNAEIVLSQTITIPVPRNDLHGHKRDESLHVQCLLQTLPASRQIWLLRCCAQLIQVRLVVLPITGKLF